MTERSSRITAEPASNCLTIRVKLFDESIQIRNFAKQGTYQVSQITAKNIDQAPCTVKCSSDNITFTLHLNLSNNIFIYVLIVLIAVIWYL